MASPPVPGELLGDTCRLCPSWLSQCGLPHCLWHRHYHADHARASAKAGFRPAPACWAGVKPELNTPVDAQVVEGRNFRQGRGTPKQAW